LELQTNKRAVLFSVVTSNLLARVARNKQQWFNTPPLAAEHTAKPWGPGLALGFNTYYGLSVFKTNIIESLRKKNNQYSSNQQSK
jgi:hypothetical protein